MPSTSSADEVLGRVYLAADWSVEAENWLEGQSGWFVDGLFREFAGVWADGFRAAFQDEARSRNLPVEITIERSVEGSWLLVAIIKAVAPYVRDALEAVGAVRELREVGRAVRRRVERRANADAHQAVGPATPAAPQQLIVVVVIVDTANRSSGAAD